VSAKEYPPSGSSNPARADEFIQDHGAFGFDQARTRNCDFLAERPARILALGVGTQGDFRSLTYLGHELVAIDSSLNSAREVRDDQSDPRIRWLNDRLPALPETYRLGLAFDLILLNAAWFQARPEERKRTFRKLVTLLAPKGRLSISFPPSMSAPALCADSVARGEVEQLGYQFGLRVVPPKDDSVGSVFPTVGWETVVLEFPDDETGALPLLRHIVLRDDKASTYKLALLRVVARVADSAPGMAHLAHDQTVSIPLGLIAVYWIRMMKPLIEADYPQTPTSRDGRGLGFVREPFRALRKVSPFELRPGMRFDEDAARALAAAIRDAASTIANMPARYITYPGRSDPVFRVRRGGIRVAPAPIMLDEPTLRAFGSFDVPAHVWRTLAHLNVWIEPVLLGEWIMLMQRYGSSQGRELRHDSLARALTWLDPARDTHLARERAAQLIESGETVHCVWSGRALSPRLLDIDHCFPFAAWPCSDLWNLLPSSRAVNQRDKRAKLVTAIRLGNAREAMLDWWSRAWAQPGQPFRVRFIEEARSSLPLISPGQPDVSLLDVFEGVQVRRALLRQDQQLPEW